MVSSGVCRNGYVSFYAVKKELTVDQYCAAYPVGVTSLTTEHRRDKDNIVKYDSNLYMIGDHTKPKNPLGIAQYELGNAVIGRAE